MLLKFEKPMIHFNGVHRVKLKFDAPWAKTNSVFPKGVSKKGLLLRIENLHINLLSLIYYNFLVRAYSNMILL